MDDITQIDKPQASPCSNELCAWDGGCFLMSDGTRLPLPCFHNRPRGHEWMEVWCTGMKGDFFHPSGANHERASHVIGNHGALIPICYLYSWCVISDAGVLELEIRSLRLKNFMTTPCASTRARAGCSH